MKKSRITIVSIILILLILTVYWPVQHYEFLNFDDQVYVTDNLHVRSGLSWQNVFWAFRSTDAGFWHPLTWLSLMMDHQLYLMNAGGYHWTNVLFHVGSTLLLFMVLHRMTGAVWRSGFVAALFAIHPLHVESVAWVAERKDVLSGLFWMLTMLAYVWYVKRPAICRYFFVLVAFILGLMSKPMLVTLPFVLLLLDYWPLGRFADGNGKTTAVVSLVIEKLPLIFLSICVGLLTYYSEDKFGALSSLNRFPLDIRIGNALVSYGIYIQKTFWPVGLSIFYPHPGAWPVWQIMLSGLLLLLMTAIVFANKKTFPYLLVGWSWFILTLAPVIGLIQLGTIAGADRYTYIPLIGIFIMIAWLVPDLLKTITNKKRILMILVFTAIALSAVVSRFQIQHWRDSFSVFQHALNVTEGNYKAHHGIGMVYFNRGDISKALFHLSESLKMLENNRARNDLGFVLMNQGRVAEAESQFRQSLRTNPQNAQAHNNLGVALATQGKYGDAIGEFKKALEINPSYPGAKDNLNLTIDSLNNKKGDQ